MLEAKEFFSKFQPNSFHYGQFLVAIRIGQACKLASSNFFFMFGYFSNTNVSQGDGGWGLEVCTLIEILYLSNVVQSPVQTSGGDGQNSSTPERKD